MAVFTSTYKPLSHGALNWDTQLDADFTALETLFATSVHVDRSGSGAINGNWDAYNSQGTYSVVGTNTNTNAPSGAYLYGILETLRGGSYLAQVYHDLNGGRWFRSYDASAWSSWRQIADTGDILPKQNGFVTLGASSADGGRFSASASVSFTAGLFTSRPIVIPSPESTAASADATLVSSVTTSGFTVKHIRDVSFASGLVVAWTAEAQTP